MPCSGRTQRSASVLLLAFSVYIRTRISESPLFAQLKARGELAESPIGETLLSGKHTRPMLAALVVAAAMALSWYTAQFYSLVFLQTALLVDTATASALIVVALLVGMLIYVGAGALSDRIGRKPVILAGMLISAISIMPAYEALLAVGNPALAAAQQQSPIVVHAAPTRFDPFANPATLDDATRARDHLAKRGISYSNGEPLVDGAFAGEPLVIRIAGRDLVGFDRTALDAALVEARYPRNSAVASIDSLDDLDLRHLALVGLILSLIVGAGLTCGPGAAWLAEIFPTRIRYTALSVPYHLTSAWFGGFMPLTAAWLVARSGDVLAGLWYPVIVMSSAFVLALWLMPETRDRQL